MTVAAKIAKVVGGRSSFDLSRIPVPAGMTHTEWMERRPKLEEAVDKVFVANEVFDKLSESGYRHLLAQVSRYSLGAVIIVPDTFLKGAEGFEELLRQYYGWPIGGSDPVRVEAVGTSLVGICGRALSE